MYGKQSARRFRKMLAPTRWIWFLPLIVIVLLAVAWVGWQIAYAQAPSPNPLPATGPAANPLYAAVPGVDVTANGQAASIHGDPGRGRALFAQDCTTCHGDRGTYGVVNPGSDDGSVPTLNPIDPGFLDDSHGDPQTFANGIDLFVQHGSRPSGDDPQISMIGWGDHQLLSQQQIADIEAYVMQLNGVYWSDRYYPPAEVRMNGIVSGDTVTYTITLVNQGGSPLGDMTLRDTLPDGLAYEKSGVPNLDGDNPGQTVGSTVQWVGFSDVPVGGTLGPFIIVARLQDPRQPVPPNVAELLFSFQTFDGNTISSSAVSQPVVAGAPKQQAAATSAPPAVAPTTAAKTATPSATITAAPTVAATAAPTLAATPSASVTPTAGATPSAGTTPSVVATPGTASPTAAASPTSAGTPSAGITPSSAGASVQIVQSQPAALSWGYNPQTITVTVGSQITWTNTGSLAHTVTADDGTFDSGNLDPGENWSFTFSKSGTYTYHCTPHPWMKATVVVQ